MRLVVDGIDKSLSICYLPMEGLDRHFLALETNICTTLRGAEKPMCLFFSSAIIAYVGLRSSESIVISKWIFAIEKSLLVVFTKKISPQPMKNLYLS